MIKHSWMKSLIIQLDSGFPINQEWSISPSYSSAAKTHHTDAHIEIHRYYGTDGRDFFFSEDRERYQPFE